MTSSTKEIWYNIPEDRIYELFKSSGFFRMFRSEVSDYVTICVAADHEIEWEDWYLIGKL